MAIQLVIAMLLQASPAPAPAPVPVSAPDTASMSAKEVEAFNATVDEDHPYYIRCRRVQVTGSLIKRGRVCRTAEEWAQTQDNGNREARTIVERSRSGMTSN